MNIIQPIDFDSQKFATSIISITVAAKMIKGLPCQFKENGQSAKCGIFAKSFAEKDGIIFRLCRRHIIKASVNNFLVVLLKPMP